MACPSRRGFAAILGLLVCALALAGCLGDGGNDRSRDGAGLDVLDPPVSAPDFQVTTTDGQEFRLSEHEGEVVMLLFMGVGCSSCEANLPDHLRLHGSHGDDPRFTIVSLNAWAVWYGEGEEELKAYSERKGIPWPIAQSTETLNQDYGVRGTPTHVFIDAEGDARATGGSLAYDALRAQVDALLAETPA